jgi:sugar/nucleoside kinase (ribokinase family)
VKLHLLVIGDIAWDIFIRPEGDLVRGSDVIGTVDVLPGGAAANVAVWAKRLGADVTLVGKLGDDTLGTLMLAHLEAEGVGRQVITVPGGLSTRVGILVSPDGEHSFVIDHTKLLRFDEGDAPAALLDSADAVFFNGYDIFLARSTSFLAPLLAEARTRRLPVVFDPSSFTLIQGFGPKRLMDGVGPLDVLIANDAEAHVLRGSRPLATLASWARLVVVKQGASGASAHTADAAWRAGVDPVTVVDTTGAGDAFDAAFLVEWLRSGDVGAALQAGNRLGAHVASHLGAQPPLPKDQRPQD